MTGDELERDPDARRAQQALRALAPVAADPEFRARLREAFETGHFTSRPARVVPLAPPRFGWLKLAAPLAAAAALVAVLMLNQAPRWQVSASTGFGVAVIDGRPVPMKHLDQLARAVRPGARIEIPRDGELELTLPGQMMIELTPGTTFTVPDVPGRWFDRSSRADLRAGEVRVTTGARFAGAQLAISTPEAEIEVSGTTLAVIREPEGTCVCVLEGHVMVGKPDAMVAVPGGRRRYVFADPALPPESAEMRAIERVSLALFRGKMTQAGQP
jgi:hypothetical protein